MPFKFVLSTSICVYIYVHKRSKSKTNIETFLNIINTVFCYINILFWYLTYFLSAVKLVEFFFLKFVWKLIFFFLLQNEVQSRLTDLLVGVVHQRPKFSDWIVIKNLFLLSNYCVVLVNCLGNYQKLFQLLM